MNMTTRGAMPGAVMSMGVARTTSGNTVATIGDSIMGAGHHNAWCEALSVVSGARYRIINNGGIAGNTSTQMLARVQTDVIAYAPSWAIIEAITPNDPAQSISVTTSVANVKAIVAAVRAAGIKPIVVLGPPNDTTGTRDHICQVNARIGPWADRQNIPVLDLYTPLADPADGTYLSSYTADGIHPNTAGVTAAATYLSTRLPAEMRAFPGLAASPSDPANCCPNGVFIGDTNADGLANSWSAVGGGVVSKSLSAMGADGIGNWQLLQGNGSLCYISAALTGWSVGDVLEFTMRVRNSGTTLNIQLQCFGGASTTAQLYHAGPGGVARDFTAASGAVVYARTTVPSTATSAYLTVLSDTSAGTLGIGQVMVRNLTVLGLL